MCEWWRLRNAKNANMRRKAENSCETCVLRIDTSFDCTVSMGTHYTTPQPHLTPMSFNLVKWILSVFKILVLQTQFKKCSRIYIHSSCSHSFSLHLFLPLSLILRSPSTLYTIFYVLADRRPSYTLLTICKI